MPAKKSKKTAPIPEAHKKALAEGRAMSRVVNAYLTALEASAPKRGRRRTPESITKRLAAIDEQQATATPLKRLALAQEELDLRAELTALTAADPTDLAALEADFVKVAKRYSNSKGITYAAWRKVGVPAATLKKAKIGRGN